MFINGKLFFEFNTLNESTDYLLKNTLNEHFDLRVYRLVEKPTLSKRSTSTSSLFNPRRLSLGENLRQRSVPYTRRPSVISVSMESLQSNVSNVSSISSDTSLEQYTGLADTSCKSIFIQRSYGRISNKGTNNQKTKKLKYNLIFQSKFELTDVPWAQGGVDISFKDEEKSKEFQWHIELLHCSRISSNGHANEVLTQQSACQLLKNVYQAEFQGMTEKELSKWNGELGKSGKNLLAILAPHFRRRSWDSMIGWTLLKLQPIFTTLNLSVIKQSIKDIQLTTLDDEESTLIAKLKIFCINRLSHFDITNTLDGSINDIHYLQDLVNILNLLLPNKTIIEQKWRDEIRSGIMMAITETNQFQPKHSSRNKLTVLANINDNLLNGYTIPNLDYIAKKVDKEFGNHHWRPLLACATLNVVFPMLQRELRRYQYYKIKISSNDMKEKESYVAWSRLTLQLHKNLTTIAKVAKIRKHAEQFERFNYVFEPCYDVWVQSCAMKALEQVNRVVELEKHKNLRFHSYSSVEVTDAVQSTRDLDAMQGAIDVKAIFYSAQRTKEQIDWLVPEKALQFGSDLYKKLYEVFNTYVEKLQEMVLEDDEFDPHELNYVLKSMFHTVAFLDNCFDKLKHDISSINHSENPTSLVHNSSTDEVKKFLLGREICRDTLLIAFCKGQKQDFLDVLTHGSNSIAHKEVHRLICRGNYSFDGYLQGLLSYFERNLLQNIEDNTISVQLKECNQILKENLIKVSEEALQQYYKEKIKSCRNERVYKNMLKTLKNIKLLKKAYDVLGNPYLIEEIENDINLKISYTQTLVSRYLDVYCSLVAEMSCEQADSPLMCFGETSFTVGIKEHRLYLAIKSVSNLIPRPGNESCNFSIQILLMPTIGTESECIEYKSTPMVENKTSHLFDLLSPSPALMTPTKTSRVFSFKPFPFSGKSKFYNKLDSYVFDFELGKTIDEPLKFLELRLYDHTLGNLIKYFRGHFILPITNSNISTITLMEEFLYGYDERFKICGKFTQYLEDYNQSYPRLKTVYNELNFRVKTDPVACNFVKCQRRLSSNYLRKEKGSIKPKK